MKRVLLTLVLSLVLLGLVPEPAEGAERPRVAAARAEHPIRVDGMLAEPDWERAPPIDAFRLILVREGEAASESTLVRVLFDDTHVYFGIWCGNRGPGPIRASLAPRDQILDDDNIIVHLDTYRDFHRAYIFGINPYGVQLDGILDGEEPDFAWDGVWDAETARSPDGWTAEVAIPLRTLRFPAGGSGVWGLWLRRQITKHDEVCSWPPWKQGEGGDIMLQGADLEGLASLQGGGRAELQPYAASTHAASRFDGGGAFRPWSTESDHQAGLDFKYSLTSTLTANATVNPDYSQVEADALQIDVNQRFPLYFPEKRPFFLEGAETYTTPFQLVYTRRVADPTYGGKLTGKVGRWRLGAIAVADNGGGSTEGIGARSSGEISRSGAFGIGRATYDIGENSSVGVLATAHVTDGFEGVVPAVVGFRTPDDGTNALVAADAKFRLAKSLFVAGQVAHSATRIDSVTDGARLRGERFSDYLSSLSAWWNDGTRYVLASQDYVGADFRAEAGFLERVDFRRTGFEASWTLRPENRWLRFVEPEAEGSEIRDTRGALQEKRLGGAVEWSFQQQTYVETRVEHVDERWLSRTYDRWRAILLVENTLWRALAAEFTMTLEDGIFYAPSDAESYLGWLETYELGATARPSPRLTSELAATRSRFAHERGGEEVYDVWLLGAKTTYQFTRRLTARLYPQYDTGAEHLDLDALLGYVIHPGSVIYLGLNGDVDQVEGRRRHTGRTAFLKVSYLFQR